MKKHFLINFYRRGVPTGRIFGSFVPSGRLVGRKNNKLQMRSVGTPGEIGDYIRLIKFTGKPKPQGRNRTGHCLACAFRLSDFTDFRTFRLPQHHNTRPLLPIFHYFPAQMFLSANAQCFWGTQMF